MRGSTFQVLVVSADADEGRVLADGVAREGGAASVVAGAAAALAAIERAPCDLVLLDLAALEGDARPVLDAIGRTRRGAAPPVVVVAAPEQRARRDAALRAGAIDFLSKPLDEVEIGCRVRNGIGLARPSRDEERYREVVESQTEMVTRWHPRRGVTFVNEAVLRYFSLGREDAFGKRFDSLVFPDDRPALDAHFASLRAEAPVGTIEHRVVLPGGDVRWQQWTNRAIFDAAGDLLEYQGVGQDITARKQAEEALRASERQLAAIYENVTGILFSVAVESDGRFRFASVNRAFLEVTGLSSEQVVGRLVDEVIPPPSCAMVLENYRTAIRKGETVRWEETSTYPAGKRHGEVAVTPVFSESGAVTRLIGIVHDVTARKQAAEALRASEERLRLFIEHAPVAIAMLDCDLCYVAASRRWSEDFGLRDLDLRGRAHYDVFPEIPAHWRAFHRRALAGEVFRSEGERFVRADGSVHWVRWKLRPWYGVGGEIAGVVIFSEDITERRRLELDRELHGLMFANMSEGVNVVRVSDATIMYVNPRFAQMFGYAPGELEGKHVSVLNRDDGSGSARARVASIAAALRERGEARVEFENVRKDGSLFWTEARISSFEHPEFGPIWVSIQEDLTDRKRGEAALRRSEEQARQAAKMEALARLASGIAHDFGTLVTAMRFFAHAVLKDEAKDEAQRRADVREIITAADHALSLARRFIDIQRGRPVAPRRVDLHEELRRIEPLLRSLAGRAVVVSIVAEAARPHVWADPGQLEQVLLNLVSNARDAMPAGGALTISTRDLDVGTAGARELGLPAAGAFVALAVCDTGIGMDEDTRAHLFEPYATTKPEGVGGGLGLFSTYGIVHQAGGCIRVESASMAGSRFEVVLPGAAALERQASRTRDVP
jgi:PAS domain S-box-containing protein